METPFLDAREATLEAVAWLKELIEYPDEFLHSLADNKEAATDCINKALAYMEDSAFELIPTVDGCYEKDLVDPFAGAAAETLHSFVQLLHTLTAPQDIQRFIVQLELYFDKFHAKRIADEETYQSSFEFDSSY